MLSFEKSSRAKKIEGRTMRSFPKISKGVTLNIGNVANIISNSNAKKAIGSNHLGYIPIYIGKMSSSAEHQQGLFKEKASKRSRTLSFLSYLSVCILTLICLFLFSSDPNELQKQFHIDHQTSLSDNQKTPSTFDQYVEETKKFVGDYDKHLVKLKESFKGADKYLDHIKNFFVGFESVQFDEYIQMILDFFKGVLKEILILFPELKEYLPTLSESEVATIGTHIKEAPKAIAKAIKEISKNITPKAKPASFNIDQINHSPEKLYRPIPNELITGVSDIDLDPIGNEGQWSDQMKSQYPWQRYKTVLEIKRSRSEKFSFVLEQALNDQKFWIRMYALMGLADLGIMVEEGKISKAIQNVSHLNQEKFLKRFIEENTAGDRYILRSLMSMSGPKVRYNILLSLKNAESDLELFENYIYAARFDPDSRVKKLAHKVTGAFHGSKLKELDAKFKDFMTK